MVCAIPSMCFSKLFSLKDLFIIFVTLFLFRMQNYYAKERRRQREERREKREETERGLSFADAFSKWLLSQSEARSQKLLPGLTHDCRSASSSAFADHKQGAGQEWSPYGMSTQQEKV